MASREHRVLAERIQATCVAAGLRVATAESCTGGRIADALTDVAGSSAYVAGGAVAYADTAKTGLLSVPADVISRHGAVSSRVARLMAEGARARMGADLAVSVTGIAGPGGGSSTKPVGLTYIGVADARGTIVRRFTWHGDREANKAASTRAALRLLARRADALALVRTGGRPAPHT